MYSSSYGHSYPFGHSTSRSVDFSQDRPKSTLTSYNSPFAAPSKADASGLPGPSWANLGRVPYQPGYLLSQAPPHIQAAANAREFDYPIIPTKAKMSHILTREYDPDSIADSMFQRPRERKFPDEEGPPMQSVTDIPNEAPDPKYARMHLERKYHDAPTTPKRPARASTEPLYVIVFGYPPDRYSTSVEYFKNLGDTTDADPNAEIMNCFKIGYKNPPEALRAIRKNGEVIAGSWMIGVKWADPIIAESLLGTAGVRTMGPFQTPDPRYIGSLDLDSPSSPNNMTESRSIGTPIKLAPSNAAFKAGHGTNGSHGGPFSSMPSAIPLQGSPNKGLVGQVSDLIFGW